MHASSDGMVTCLNCEHTFEGKFCNQCGQKAATHRYTVGHVLHELPHSVFHLDKGIFRNIKSILNPRKAVMEYMQGKRIAYFNPLLFFFMSAGLIMFLDHYLFGESPEFTMDINDWNANGYDAGKLLTRSVKYIYFCSAFIYAIPNYYLFRKETGFNYAEHVLAGIFVLGYVNLAFLLFINSNLGYGFPLNPTILSLMGFFTFVVFYQGNFWKMLLKSAASTLGLLVLFCAFMLTLGYIGSLVHGILH